nr:hypothetical protein [Tanacetum cinerariifolium]
SKMTANGDESKLVQTIVDKIFKDLRSISSSVDGKLVGMEMRISEVLASSKICTEDVCVIGIKGMGGGGKTTLARAIYDRISSQFEGKSFVENVKEVSKTSLSGLKSLQKQVLSDVVNDQGITVSSVHDGKNMMEKMMPGRKVLVVLDDVDHIQQLEALAGKPDWFKSGKIPIQGYEQLSGQVVRYAAGLPLTIKILGSFLCGKNELEWKDVLERLKTVPQKETQKKSLIATTEYGSLGMHDLIEEMGKNIVFRLHPDDPNRQSRL